MKYQITVPKPCHENWNGMSKTQQGKFCQSCNKEVVDFTKLTTSEISRKVFSKDNLCGRFKEDQLNKEIATSKKHALSKIAASIVLVSAITASEPIFSQSKKDTIIIKNHQKENVFINDNSDDDFFEIKGKVKGESLDFPGVNIVLKGTNIGTQTDFDGNFSIKIPNKKTKSTILVFSYLGYKNQEIDVLAIKKPLVVELEEDDVFLGEVVITTGMIAIEKKPNVFKKIGNFFRKKENRKY